MEKYDPQKMIDVDEAKAYAFGRRFEVSAEKRVRVWRGTLESVAFIGDDPACWTRPVLFDFPAWDPYGVSRTGRKGACRWCFDRAAFLALFGDYGA